VRRRVATGLAIALLAPLAACSGDDDPSAVPPAASEPSVDTAPAEDSADPVEQTRAAILAAVAAGDYDALEPLIDAETFLSDAGFGADPIEHWRSQGTAPLEAMAAVLSLPSTVLETNEGQLHQWPRLTADSDPEDMSEQEREVLTGLLGEEALAQTFNSETGYVAPRLAILADGTWFSFIQNPAP
jgi:predicted small lipoprotein YifL